MMYSLAVTKTAFEMVGELHRMVMYDSEPLPYFCQKGRFIVCEIKPDVSLRLGHVGDDRIAFAE